MLWSRDFSTVRSISLNDKMIGSAKVIKTSFRDSKVISHHTEFAHPGRYARSVRNNLEGHANFVMDETL